MSDGIDPAVSACVLIGVDKYTHLERLRSVRKNLTGLQAALTDSAIWGLPQERLKVVPNPGTQQELIGPIREMARQASDTLIVYYSGHGIKDPKDGQFYLTLPDSEDEYPETAVQFNLVRRVLSDAAAPRKVVILDCCFSGSALGAMGSSNVADEVKASFADDRGVYLMTSAARDRGSLAPHDETYTAFTGELIGVLNEGIPNGPPRLGLDDVFGRAKAELERKRRPVPQKNENEAGKLPFVHNRAFARKEAPPQGPARVPARLWWVTAATAVVALAVPYRVGPAIANAVWPAKPGGACSPDATLLSYSDKLNKAQVDNERVIGLSALAFAKPAKAQPTVMALTDDSNNDLGRVFPISLGPDSPEHLNPVAERAITLTDPRGKPYSAANFDGEGLVMENGGRTMLVSSEVGPSIHRFRVSDGRETGPPLPIPPQFRNAPEGQAEVGRTIESLSATPDGRYLFAGMESSLASDGDNAGHTILRIQRYHGRPGGTYTPDRQYAYLTDTGLDMSDFVALDKDHLITLQRQYVDGLGNAVHVHEIWLDGARDVTGMSSLYNLPADDFVKDSLLFDLAKCPAGSPGQVQVHEKQPNPLLDNVEGIAVGPPRQSGDHKGWRPLYLVTDDNDNPQQITRLYALLVHVSLKP